MPYIYTAIGVIVLAIITTFLLYASGKLPKDRIYTPMEMFIVWAVIYGVFSVAIWLIVFTVRSLSPTA